MGNDVLRRYTCFVRSTRIASADAPTRGRCVCQHKATAGGCRSKHRITAKCSKSIFETRSQHMKKINYFVLTMTILAGLSCSQNSATVPPPETGEAHIEVSVYESGKISCDSEDVILDELAIKLDVYVLKIHRIARLLFLASRPWHSVVFSRWDPSTNGPATNALPRAASTFRKLRRRRPRRG